MCCCRFFSAQFAGTVDPKNFEFGQNKAQLHSTMGLPNGCNAQHPTQYMRKHEKEPVLPDRECVNCSLALDARTIYRMNMTYVYLTCTCCSLVFFCSQRAQPDKDKTATTCSKAR